jgi:hypothetical protein
MASAHIRLGEYVIGRVLPPGAVEHHAAGNPSPADSDLRRCLSDVFAMYALRALLSEDGGAMGITQLDDREVVARAAQLIACGRLRLGYHAAQGAALGAARAGSLGAGSPGRASSRTGQRTTDMGRASAVAPEAPRAVGPPVPTTRAALPDEGTFGPDVDGATLAATLRAAAEAGVPFCEECERGRRDRAPRAA